MGSLDAQAARLEAAVAAILALRRRVEAIAPWPLAELYGTEASMPREPKAYLHDMRQAAALIAEFTEGLGFEAQHEAASG